MALDLYNQFRIQFEQSHPPIPGTFDKEKASGEVIASAFEIGMGNYYLDDLYKQVDLAEPQLLEAIKKIADFIRQHFKGKKPIKIEAAKKEQAAP